MVHCHRIGSSSSSSSSCGPRGLPCRLRRCCSCCSCCCCGGHQLRCHGRRTTTKARCCRWTSSCGAPCTKALLVVVNFVFLVCGLVFVCVGLQMLYVDKESSGVYVDLLHAMPSSGPLVVLDRLPSVFIGIGTAVFVLSFLGCYGACEESVCFLCMYTLLLLLILSTEIITGSMLTVFRDKISLSLQSLMRQQLRYDYNKSYLPVNETDPATYQVTFTWDTMQAKLNCCGAVGPQDYKYSAWFNNSRNQEGMFAPLSCCVLLNDGVDDTAKGPLRPVDEDICQIDAILDRKHSTALKTQGCHESAVKWLEANISSVIVIAANVIAVQILHFLFACSLLSRLKRSHSDYQWYEEETDGGGWQGA